MSAEAIAKVVADLRSDRITRLLPHDEKHEGANRYAGWVAGEGGPVVDATAIYTSLVNRDDPVALYEDHPCIAPPWDSASICYVNEHGNVVVMTAVVHEMEWMRERFGHLWAQHQQEVEDHRVATQPGPWQPAQPVDWDQTRWLIDTFVWIGGRSADRPHIPTAGPCHHWQFAVYEDGAPADLHWVQLLPDYPMEHWDMAHLVLLGALNVCNCRNVELVNPKRPNAERKRIARTGIDVHTINVFPAGRSTRAARSADASGTPLTPVRGHFAKYGPEYGRGLLFGKYAGRYWIPQHARGDASLGESKADYRLEAG